MMKNGMRNGTIEVLRFIMAIAVICAHFRNFYLYQIGSPWFNRCYIADEFFFIIAGIFFAKACFINSDGNIYKYLSIE